MEQQIKKKMIVLTGAGMSEESGLQTFRDQDGLWENHKVEDVASIEAWNKNPQLVLNFYNSRRAGVEHAQPNKGHLLLAELEQYFDVQIITQNVDDLHERAGSSKVLHLHGEIKKMRSVEDDSTLYDYMEDIQLGDVDNEGHQLRPHIVWFGEAVPEIENAIPLLENADIFVLIGSSLSVYPAAGLLDFVDNDVPKYVIDKNIPEITRHHNIIPINQSATEGLQTLKNYLLKN